MVSHGYPPTVSGVTLVVQKLARAMVRRGHSVCVVTSSETREPYEDDDEGVHLVRLHAAPNPLWQEGPIPYASHKEMEELAHDHAPDIIHSHDSGLLGLQAQRVSDDCGVPLLATCYYVPRFLARHLALSREPSDVVESLVWSIATWFYNRHDHVVFATQAHRESFFEAGLHAPTTIISNGVDIGRYRPQPGHAGEGREIAERYHLPEGKRILFVGRLAKDKEIDILIKAMATVRQACDAHLLIVGRGDYREHLEHKIEELDLGGCCHLLGFVPEADMPALYRAVDLFAIAATTEVQSLPTLEACATGLPVVAANALALPELVHDGINGYLAQPGRAKQFGQACARILCDPALAREMGVASLRIAQPHDEQETFAAYERAYEGLVDGGRGATM
jgi:glycosyltransferase involved in cell wall biosynthesis